MLVGAAQISSLVRFFRPCRFKLLDREVLIGSAAPSASIHGEDRYSRDSETSDDSQIVWRGWLSMQAAILSGLALGLVELNDWDRSSSSLLTLILPTLCACSSYSSRISLLLSSISITTLQTSPLSQCCCLSGSGSCCDASFAEI